MAKRRPFTMSVVVSEYRGDWTPQTRYYAGDIIRAASGIYGALRATLNVPPPAADAWIPIYPPTPYLGAQPTMVLSRTAVDLAERDNQLLYTSPAGSHTMITAMGLYTLAGSLEEFKTSVYITQDEALVGPRFLVDESEVRSITDGLHYFYLPSPVNSLSELLPATRSIYLEHRGNTEQLTAWIDLYGHTFTIP